MTNSGMLEKAVDAIIVLNAAFTNIRLYPPTSAMIAKSIDGAYSILQEILAKEDALIFAESDQTLLVSGQALAEKDNQRPQLTSFVQLMLKQDIKNIVFMRGLERSELLDFLGLMAGKPDDLQNKGGIRKAMSDAEIKNILLNQDQDLNPDNDRTTSGEKEVNAAGAPDSHDKGQGMHIKSGIERILKGEENAFRDRLVMQALPKIVFDLMTHQKEKTADAILLRLGAALLNEKEGVRGEASLAFARIGAKLLSEKRASDMIRHCPRLIKWVRFETVMLPAFKHITHQLQLLSQYLVLNHRFKEAVEILKSFHMIATGELKRDESIRVVSADMLQGMARDEVINSLAKDIQTDLEGFGQQAVEILAMLGSGASGPFISLLDKISAQKSSLPKADTVRLQKGICDALGRIGSRDAMPALKAIVERVDEPYDDEVKAAAGQAMDMILKTHGGTEAQAPEKKDWGSSHGDKKIEPTKQAAKNDEYISQMDLVEQHIKNNDTGAATTLLFEMIVRYAGEKDFEKAEHLRDKLMEAAPMALNDIIKSGEIIEQEKSKSIDQEHMKLWSELYKNLTDEETTTLFFTMKSVRHEKGHTIFKKGDHDSRLYFINKGRIKLVINQGDKEVLVKELKPGDMLGEDAFFSLSLCTTTAITLSEVELNYLEKDVLSKWEMKSYGIEPKLHDYYLKTKKVDEPLEAKGLQQRTQERIPISGKVKVQFMDSSGIPSGEAVTGALSDISMGGMSFYLNIKKDKITRLFAEPRLNVKFSLTAKGSEQRFDQNGTMVAAIPHYYDYSIHVKFDNKLDKQLIEAIKESKASDSGGGELEMLIDS